MNHEVWQKLKQYVGKPLVVEICNNYGEKGMICGKINEKIIGDKRSYACYFDVKSKKGKGPIMLDLLLERPIIMHDELFGEKDKDGNPKKVKENIDTYNSLNVLRIIDPKTTEVLYRNPNKKTLLEFPVNKSNFNVNSKINEKWKNKTSTRFLLSNLGQYMEVTQNGEVIDGVLKSVYRPSKCKDTYVLLIKPFFSAQIKLEDNANIKVFPNMPRDKAKLEMTYKAPKPEQEEVIELK